MKVRYALGFLAALALIALAVGVGFVKWDYAVTLACLFGAATVSYTWPGAGATGTIGTTPPTTVYMQNYNSVRATITFGDTDTTATLTHNLGLSTTQIAQGFPDVSFGVSLFTTPAETAPLVVSYTNGANATTFTKVSATDSGCLVQVLVARPLSTVT